jgi:hypothetical protein
MRRLLFVCVALLPLRALASHIVGGEFEILHQTGFTYRVNLILYFDELNGLQGAKDPSVTAYIYRKSDNAMMRSVFLPTFTPTPVSYTQPECSHGEIVTTKLLYSTTLTLDPEIYDDPEGYYLVWERCCRNYTITNIFSQEPIAGSGNISAGQTFYLEFPPVTKNGQPFVNSSPQLFPPLNDYACPGRPYYTDFAGTDADGDSLVYSLVNPLNTTAAVALPGPNPRPYPDVQWQPPFSLSNILGGSPDLKINKDGFLTVTPGNQGLYVFAVKCEEFRDGEKIGEVRRDFQMLVLDICPVADPPQILGQKAGEVTYSHDELMQVMLAPGAPEADRCFSVRVSDPDASKPEDNFQERITIKAIAINFKDNVSEVLPEAVNATLINGSTRDFAICLPECPFVKNGFYQIGIIAFDDACSLPLSDTLVVEVTQPPPPNVPARFTSNDVNALINEGDLVTWPVSGVDDDGDPLTLAYATNGFNLADFGFAYDVLSQSDGSVNAQLTWDSRCNVYDFTERTAFTFRFLLDDADECNFSDPDFSTFNLNIKLPGNADPVIDTDLGPLPSDRKIEGYVMKINETLNFNVTGTDADGDTLVLSLVGSGFDPGQFGMVFPQPLEGIGNVAQSFSWTPLCTNTNLATRDVFQLQFKVVDNSNKCRFYKADTLDVEVKVLAPDNQPPELTATSLLAESPLVNNAMDVYLGREIQIEIRASDADAHPDKDKVELTLFDAYGDFPPEGYAFEDVTGEGEAVSVLRWNPECSIFKGNDFENEYSFRFVARDDRCYAQLSDSLTVNVTVRDIESDEEAFEPPNVFTPNGDGFNDYYAMERFDPESNMNVNVLPPDNCLGVFEGIQIYNRWGRRVFESSDRDFRWLGINESPGVYYYHVKYSNREYKGSVSLRN